MSGSGEPVRERPFGGRDPLAERDPRHVDWLVALTRPLRGAYRLLGVDYRLMAHLLRARLLLEHRRRKGRDGTPGLARNTGFTLMLGLYAALGFILGSCAFLWEDPRPFLTLVATAVAFFLVLSILLDFTSVLLDTTDLALLAPLPVPDRLVLAVRVTHISLYVSLIAGSLALGPLILGTIRFASALYPPVLLLGVAQMTGLSLAGVVVLYLVALKSLDLSRFRDAMVYLQTGAFLVFFGVSQLGPQLARRTGFDEWLGAHSELLCAWPPASVGALGRIALGHGEALDGWILLCGWGGTAAVVALGAGLARRGFVHRLAEMEKAGGTPRAKPGRRGLTGRLGSRFAGGRLERAGWDFFVQLSSSERLFRLRVMPLGVLVAMPIAMLAIQGSEEGMGPVLALLVYLPYVPLMILPSIWETARFSEKWEAGAVFGILSRDERQSFARGAMRATYLRFLVLPLVVILAVVLCLADRDDWTDLALSVSVALAGGAWALPRFGGFLPFTKRFSTRDAQSNTIALLLAGLATLVLVAMQWGLGKVPHATPVVAAVAAALIWPAWRRLGRVKLRTRGKFEYEPY